MAKRRTKRPSAPDPFGARIGRLRKLMSAQGVSSLIVSDPMDVAYLTGFLGGDSYLLVPKSGKPSVVSDFRYQEDLEPLKPRVKIVMRTGSMADTVAPLLAGRASKVGFQSERMTVSEQKSFASALRKQKARQTLKPTSGLVAQLRMVKDDSEVRLIRKAVKIQEAALEATLPQLSPGMSESEICAILEFEMKRRGSTEPSFATIVAAKANGSRPHYTPASTKTAKGKPLLIDFGAIWHGYHSDMTRTFSFGTWSKQMREIYQIVLGAHEAAADAIEPGMTGRQAHDIAERYIDEHEYANRFGHGLGHGIGLNIHEGPGLGKRGKPQELVPGMVVTIEPGIYLPGVGGVRIEDDYLVTGDGLRNLCSLPKDIEWATL